MADDSYFHEYKANVWSRRGETIIAGKMWLKGMPVGVIASNASGVIYIEAARKATEWMIRCGNSEAAGFISYRARPATWSARQKNGAASANTAPTWSVLQRA